MTSAPELAYWILGAPVFRDGWEADRARLGTHLGDGVELLRHLPPRRARDRQHRLTVHYVHEESRQARAGFLARHASEIHRRIAAHHAAPRMADLLRTGEALFPELVPAGPDQELDRALFITALVRDPEAGPRVVDAMRAPTRRARRLLGAFRHRGRVDLGRAHIRRAGTSAHITLTTPGAGNAEDDVSVADLEVAVDLALLHDDVRVAVLRGGPVAGHGGGGRRVFSAGVDVAGLDRGAVTFAGFVLRREFGVLAKVAWGLVDPARQSVVGKPWLAVVDTVAAGCGADALAAFDRVLVAADACAVPSAHGAPIDAAGMVARGLADVVAEPDEMDSAVGRETARLRARSGPARMPDLGVLAARVQERLWWLNPGGRTPRTERAMVD
jgi:thioesterase DpgC